MYNKQLHVLSQKELKDLLRVETSKKQAEQILKRNEILLAEALRVRKLLLNGVSPVKIADAVVCETLEDGDDDSSYDGCFIGRVGCPHCNESYDCQGCAWQVKPFLSYASRTSRFCLEGSFRGFKLRDIMVGDCWLHYAHNNERLDHGNLEVLMDENSADWLVDNYVDPVITFLRGHIEWAKVVLAGGFDFGKEKKT